ncbi:MAG: hypothetical protein M1830_004026, partial [Pleopsidium flavum]
MPDKSSLLLAAAGVSTVGGHKGKRKANESDVIDDTLNGPKALKRFDNIRWQEQEAYWSAQHGMSKRQQTLTRRQVEREEEEQRDRLKLLIAKAVEEAVAKNTVRGEAKATAVEFKERYAGLGEDHGNLKNQYLSLYEEKQNLRKQLTIEHHVHPEGVTDLEARLDEYADDQETGAGSTTASSSNPRTLAAPSANLIHHEQVPEEPQSDYTKAVKQLICHTNLDKDITNLLLLVEPKHLQDVEIHNEKLDEVTKVVSILVKERDEMRKQLDGLQKTIAALFFG